MTDCSLGARDYSLGPRIIRRMPYPELRAGLEVADPSGAGVEFGVGKGVSLRIIADALQPAVGFDSFAGLPEDWHSNYRKGLFACPIPKFHDALIVVGLFEHTLSGVGGFDFTWLGNISLVHFDADLYSSTATALKYIGPHLRSGTVLVFDEWHNYNGCENHEQRAWREYVEAHPDLSWQVIGHGGQPWVIQLC